MGEWTSLRDILQDLSVAQGCMVPACLETYDDRPPPFSIPEEECEEQPYLESGGGGDIAGPDYDLIQQMLNMVKEKKQIKEDDPASASDLNPMSSEFVPKKEQRKIERNVALSSIITAQKKKLASRRPIPNDVIPTMFKRKSINSPNLNGESPSPSQMSSPEINNQFSPSSRANDYYSKYLRKSKLKEEFEEDIWLRAEHGINEIENRRNGQTDLSPPLKNDNNQYIPSRRATEYYSKYVQKSRLKEQIEEDIWTRAERQMKEIDARKKRKEQVLSSQETTETDAIARLAYAYEMVNLPHHRHELSEQCVVCSVASKHGYKFQE